MSCQSRLAEWTTVIRTHLPLLSQPQATVLALWSLGMVLRALVCPDRRGRLSGRVAPPQGADRAATAAGVL